MNLDTLIANLPKFKEERVSLDSLTEDEFYQPVLLPVHNRNVDVEEGQKGSDSEGISSTEEYGRMRVVTVQDPQNEESPATVRDIAVHYAIMGIVHGARRRATRRITSVGDHIHIHTPRACLSCATRPYIQYNKLHAVEMTVLRDLLDFNGMDELWNFSTTPKTVKTRLRNFPISERDLEQIYGPFWKEVILTALYVEDNPHAALVEAADFLPELSRPKPFPSGRDYTHAASRLVGFSKVLDEDSTAREQLLHKAVMQRWKVIAEAVSAGEDIYPLVASLNKPSDVPIT